MVHVLKRGDRFDVSLESPSGDGRCVGRAEGVVCFVDGGVPGDLVRAVVRRVRQNHIEAAVDEVLAPSRLRTGARCLHFGTCGGCQWQNLEYEAQLSYKRRRVVDVFERIGGMRGIEVLPVIGCPDTYRYRNKMEYTFSNNRWLSPAEFLQPDDHPGELALGLHPPERFDKIVSLRQCLLPSPRSEAILIATAEYFRERGTEAYSTRTHTGYLRHLVIREGRMTGETMVNLVTTWDRPAEMRSYTEFILGTFPDVTTVVNNVTDRMSMVAQGEREAVYHGPGTIREMIGPCTFRISANSFFQTNTAQAGALFDAAVDLADLSPSDSVYDLYCGTGAIAIYISGHAGRVLGIEENASAVRDAERNAGENGIANCRFIRATLPGGLDPESGEIADFGPPTAVVVDPPRSGLHEKLIGKILRLAPAKVLYVSCNAATQARDVKLFADAGYAPGPVRPVDMFPHTDHIETVTVLSR